MVVSDAKKLNRLLDDGKRNVFVIEWKVDHALEIFGNELFPRELIVVFGVRDMPARITVQVRGDDAVKKALKIMKSLEKMG